jgi:release factor glutamine methyltransferase
MSAVAGTNLAEVLRTATALLAASSSSPRLDAELLLCHVLGVSRAGLVTRDADALDDAPARAYRALLEERNLGVPVAYLVGTREFWSLPLGVSPAVLVPRPETELLVTLSLERLAPEADVAVLDLGTGSGAIALALASERPRARCTAVDVSLPALEVARANGIALGLSRIGWRLSNWFEALRGLRYSLIVSNPPYVAAADPALAALHAEPRAALTPGPSGLEALRIIIEAAPAHLEPGGWLLLEHGSTQGEAVAALLAQHGFDAVRTHRDFAGNARVTIGQLSPTSGTGP